jgi:methionyl aminopeptidase
MSLKVKTDEEIIILREGGKRLARILRTVGEAVRPGINTKDLNALAQKLIEEGGDVPSLVGYQPRFAKRPYPAALCVSINDEVVHGIPNENEQILKEGDIVGLDLVLTHKNLLVDAAITVPVGKIDEAGARLIRATKVALDAAISAARAENRIGDISHAIEETAVSSGFAPVYELGGHGVGYAVHEEPMVPNVGERGKGHKLLKNMVLAIEPILSEGEPDVELEKDGYTYKTVDGKRSAHFEHTIVITDGSAEVLTVE